MIRILLAILALTLGAKAGWADDADELKEQIVQVVKEYRNEIFSEAMKEFNNMDTNGSGYVSLKEFINFRSYGSVEQKTQAFNLMDSDHDGKLAKEELWLFIHERMKTIR